MMNEDALYLLLVPLMLNNPILSKCRGTWLLRGRFSSSVPQSQLCHSLLEMWVNHVKLLIL